MQFADKRRSGRNIAGGQGISMSTNQHPHEPHARESEIIHLSNLSGYQTFGTMLALIRARNGLSQQQIAEASKPYLRSRRMSFDRRMYGRLENDERFPAFAELEPLYRTFVEVFLEDFDESAIKRFQFRKCWEALIIFKTPVHSPIKAHTTRPQIRLARFSDLLLAQAITRSDQRKHSPKR